MTRAFKVFLAFCFAVWAVLAPAQAALTVNQLGGFNVNPTTVVVGPRTLTYITSGTSASATSLTIASAAIGTASSDRMVVVAVSWSDSAVSLSSVTVGGTALPSRVSTGNFEAKVSIRSELITSGTTADVVVTMSGGSTIIHAAVYTVLLNGATTTPTNTQTDTSVSGGVLAPPSLTVNANGVYVAAFSADATNATWTNATERSEANLSSTGSRGGSASGTASAAVSVSASGMTSPGVMAVASW